MYGGNVGCGIDHTGKNIPTAADMHPVSLKPADGYTYLYRVNCGGDDYRDTNGNLWSQDNDLWSHSWAKAFGLNPFTASQGHMTDSIHGTNDDVLFQSFRWGRDKLGYDFDVPDGSMCRVELYFAEPWLGARDVDDCEGERVFSVAVNDTVLKDIDPWAEAGFAGALKKVVYVRPQNGKIHIGFPDVKAGEAVISAIAIATDNISSYALLTPTTHHLSPDYWHSLDGDTLAQYPKSLLPKDAEAFPVSKYTAKKLKNSFVWTITPGVAREYALRFRYKNTTSAPVKARLTITDRNGIVLQDRAITYPPTPKKFKTLSTTTGTQINAGSYSIAVIGGNGLEFDYLEVQ